VADGLMKSYSPRHQIFFPWSFLFCPSPATAAALQGRKPAPPPGQKRRAIPAVTKTLFCRPRARVSRPIPPELKSRTSARRPTMGKIFRSKPPPTSKAKVLSEVLPPVKSGALKRPEPRPAETQGERGNEGARRTRTPGVMNKDV